MRPHQRRVANRAQRGGPLAGSVAGAGPELALVEAGGGPDALRAATGSGPYLAAVRAQLLRAGITGDVDPDRQEGSSETRMVKEALTRITSDSRPVPDETVEQVRGRLASALEERDGLLRERARLEAVLDSEREQSRLESERADMTEKALGDLGRRAADEAAKRRTQTVTDVVRTEIKGLRLPDGIRSGLEHAITLADHDPDAGVVHCRKVLEIVARQSWLAVMAADALPQDAKFGALMEQLKDQRGVDMPTWHMLRTLYTSANSAAHEVGAASRGWASAIILCTAHAASRALGSR